MFEGFESLQIQTTGARIALRRKGNGPGLLLLHGYPQTHAMWHRLAPRLAERYTVVCPDLRGYGASSKPVTDSEHAPYGKRAMALDQVEVMHALGFERFAVVGHDRGGRCAYRLALDHPERVAALSVLDILPTAEHFDRADKTFALGYFHWFFLVPCISDLSHISTRSRRRSLRCATLKYGKYSCGRAPCERRRSHAEICDKSLIQGTGTTLRHARAAHRR